MTTPRTSILGLTTCWSRRSRQRARRRPHRCPLRRLAARRHRRRCATARRRARLRGGGLRAHRCWAMMTRRSRGAPQLLGWVLFRTQTRRFRSCCLRRAALRRAVLRSGCRSGCRREDPCRGSAHLKTLSRCLLWEGSFPTRGRRGRSSSPHVWYLRGRRRCHRLRTGATMTTTTTTTRALARVLAPSSARAASGVRRLRQRCQPAAAGTQTAFRYVYARALCALEARWRARTRAPRLRAPQVAHAMHLCP